jgi:hypothetical protein
MIGLSRATGDAPRVARSRAGRAGALSWALAMGAAGLAFAGLLAVLLAMFNALALAGPPGVMACLGGLVGALAGAGAGLVAGWGQARALRDRLPGRHGWVRATVAGGALAGFLGFYAVILLGWQFTSVDLVGAALALGAAVVGAAQGLHLGLGFRRLGGWIAVNALGAALAWVVARAVWGTPPIMDPASGLAGGAGFLFPAVVGAIAGLATALALRLLGAGATPSRPPTVRG